MKKTIEILAIINGEVTYRITTYHDNGESAETGQCRLGEEMDISTNEVIEN